ncbi:MAG: DUF169 domain-containing protein [Chloroflexota bacterium]
MEPLKTDLSIFKGFNFEKSPVGVKFLFFKPDGIEQLDKQLPFCEMIKEAQERKSPFYFTKENENCIGKFVLGMEELPLFVATGQLGPRLKIYQEARANSKLYQYVPEFEKGKVNYVVYSPLDQLTFDPDLLILMTTISQAEVVLRAMSYSTGEIWEPKAAPALNCPWIYIHPYKNGKVNYTVTGLAFGSKAKQIFEEGWMLISIPYNWIPTIAQNLKEMDWVPEGFTDGREGFMKREEGILEELARMSQNP